jgi:hypothetical protein
MCSCSRKTTSSHEPVEQNMEKNSRDLSLAYDDFYHGILDAYKKNGPAPKK